MQSPGDEYDGDAAQHLEEGNESNAALLQLQDAFVSALTSSGVLGKIRAELRASALSLIRGDEDLQRAAVGDVFHPSTLSASSKLSLLLLYDFLQHHRLRQTAGVLEVEGSVHLLVMEQDALFGDLQTLPGDGPLLERLVDSFHRTKCYPSLEKSESAEKVPPHSSEMNERPLPLPSEPQASSQEETATAIALPENEDVRRGFDAYESSLAFSDVDGRIDDQHQCDEVENI